MRQRSGQAYDPNFSQVDQIQMLLSKLQLMENLVKFRWKIFNAQYTLLNG